MSKYLYVEGSNFSSTIFDTADISTIRGASRAYENTVADLAKGLGPSVLEIGASKLVAETHLTFDELNTARPDTLEAVRPHLNFNHGSGETLAEAEAAARGMQFRNWTVTGAGEAGQTYCALDGKRVASRRSAKGDLSESVFARRQYGLGQRSGFYRDSGGWMGLTPAQHFSQLIEDPPAGLAFGAEGKIAVIGADGAGFGLALANLTAKKGARGRAEFSQSLRALQANLLKDIQIWFEKLDEEVPGRAFLHQGDLKIARFETLLFGGDDMEFVLPGWLALPFITAFLGFTSDWEIDGIKLTHRVCGVIAQYKTPIRQLRDCVQDGIELLREAHGSNTYSLDLLESVVPPADGLMAHRKRIFGASVKPEHFAWDLSKSDEFLAELDRIANLSDDNLGLKRSQLYRLLAGLNDLGDPLAETAVTNRYFEHAARTGKPTTSELPRLSAVTAPQSVHLALISQFIDFVSKGK